MRSVCPEGHGVTLQGLVPDKGLEPLRLSASELKSDVSTSIPPIGHGQAGLLRARPSERILKTTCDKAGNQSRPFIYCRSNRTPLATEAADIYRQSTLSARGRAGLEPAYSIYAYCITLTCTPIIQAVQLQSRCRFIKLR